MDTNQERRENFEMQSQPASERIQHAMQELRKSGNAQSSTSQSNFTDSCNELLHLSFYSEEGTLRVIQSLSQLNGNFVVQIISKGLAGLKQVYCGRTFENESIELVKLCVSLYQKQRDLRECYQTTTSPATVVNCAVELCDELMNSKSFGFATQSDTLQLLSIWLPKLVAICDTIISARLLLCDIKTNVQSLIESDGREPIETFKHMFNVIKSRIGDDLFEDLIEETLAITKRDLKLNFLNISRHNGFTAAMLLHTWQKFLELPFVTTWFAVQTAKKDVLLHDEDYAQRLSFGYKETYNESLINQVFITLKSLSSEGHYELAGEERLQVFLDHPEIFLRNSPSCFHLLGQSNTTTECIQMVFKILGIHFNKNLLPLMTDAQVRTHNELIDEFLRVSQFTTDENIFNALEEQRSKLEKQSPASLTHHQTIASVIGTLVQAMGRLENQQPILQILSLWKLTFTDDDCEYKKLSQICVLLNAILQMEKNESSVVDQMVKVEQFFSKLPKDLHSTFDIWYSILADVMKALPTHWTSNVINFLQFYTEKHLEANRTEDSSEGKISIFRDFLKILANNLPVLPEEINEKSLELAVSFFDKVPLAGNYKLVICFSVCVVAEMGVENSESYLVDFVHGIEGKDFGGNHDVVTCALLISSIPCYCSTEKTEIFQRFLNLIQRSSTSENLINTLNVSKSVLDLQVNASSTVKFFDFIETGDQNLTICTGTIWCLNRFKLQNMEGLNEFVSFMFAALSNEVCCSKQNCELFIKEVTKILKLFQTSIAHVSKDIVTVTIQTVLACVAGSIAIGNFDEIVNDLVVKSIFVSLGMHKNKLVVGPFEILALYIKLTKAFQQIKTIAPVENELYINNFICGLKNIFKLPLPLFEKIYLIGSVLEVLKRGRFNTAEEICKIMGHLFETKDITPLQFNLPGLSYHLKELMVVYGLDFFKKLTRIPINTKVIHKKEDNTSLLCGSSITLMSLLVEKTPSAFAEKKSNGLFDFVVKRLEKRNFAFSFSLMSMAIAVIKKNITPVAFKEEFKEMENIFNHVHPFLIPLVLQCITECHLNGLTQEKEIRSLILLLRDFKWKEDDLLNRTNNSLGSLLNLAKQIVLAFKETSGIKERKKEIERVLDVMQYIKPQILYGGVSPEDGKPFQIFQTLAPHDFHVLMRYTHLKPKDVSTVMLAYTHSDEFHFPLEESTFTMDEARLDADTNWSEDYDPSTALTPGKITYLILQNLRRLRINENDLKSETLSIFRKMFERHSLVTCLSCPPQNFKDYIMVFACIMKRSRSVEEIKQWLELSGHDIVACKEVIVEAYSEVRKREKEESLEISQELTKVFFKLTKNITGKCISSLSQDLQCIIKVLRNIEHKETIFELFELLFISVRSTTTCVDIIVGWNKSESHAFLTKLKEKYPEDMGTSSPDEFKEIDNKIAVWLPLLPFVSKAFPNHAENVSNFLDKFLENGLNDPKSLTRIPIWFKNMTDAGFSQQIIESWCSSLILYENLTLSDVYAITILTPSTIQAISKQAGEIEECLFRANAPKSWNDEDSQLALQTNINSFKRCLRFAKILNEFASIAVQFKENSKVLVRIQEKTHTLCSSFKESPASSKGLYKVLSDLPKELFVLLFAGEDETKEDSLSVLKSNSELSQSLAVAFRRLARSVTTRPILFGHLKSIVDQILQHLLTNTEEDFQTLQFFVHKKILALEPNQDTMHSLQAAGYNQSSPNEDLWNSSSIQASSNVPRIISVKQFRTRRLLIQMTRQWRSILRDLDIKEIEVNGEKVKITDMDHSDMLETMESQLEAAKNATESTVLNDWCRQRREQLIQHEKRCRHEIEEQEKQATTAGTEPDVAKLLIIWSNQFFESINACSEKIPACYSPNGFHSEKPVICGLSVDNRIITLFKEEKNGKLAELEDVEVKLYPVGMLVFGLYRCGFAYDTDQLWAAFFKELLLNRLVPKIFLTNVSPGFEWINKRFVQPETTAPHDIRFYQKCNLLIPTREDYFDYEPTSTVRKLHTALEDDQMKELIILTPDNVAAVKFKDLQSPNRDKIERERRRAQRKSFENAIENDPRLLKMHPQSHKTILKRLQLCITETLKSFNNGDQRTEEIVEKSIDMKLLGGKDLAQEVNKNKKAFYCRIILDALRENVLGNTDESDKAYEFVVNRYNANTT